MSSKELAEEQWLRSTIIPEIIQNGRLIESCVNVEHFKLHSVEIKFIGADEAFMLTICYKAKIGFEYKDNTLQERKVVVKKTPEIPEETFKAINFPALFSNEINCYTIILPAIQNFAKVKINVPKYYFGELRKNAATIILEDFNESGGWKMTTARVNLNLEHALLAVKYLATFHGACFALKDIDSPLFQGLIEKLREPRYASPDLHPDWVKILNCSVERIISATRCYHSEVPEEFLRKLQNLISDNYRYGYQRVRPVEPMATLCHGDYLRNNVAYKYDENTGQPIDVMMFDFQTMRYSSPMIDLSVFLALSTFKTIRYQFFEDIFDTYRQVLVTTYKEHTNQQQLPSHLSYNYLMKEYIRFLPYSIAVAASFLMTLVEPSEISIEKMLNTRRTPEEIEEDTMKRGGAVVDCELAHQAKEMYELVTKYQVDICEGIIL